MPSTRDEMKWSVDVASACHQLALFMRGEIKLTEAKFDALQDELLEFLEESNNHRYRFGRTIPRSE